MEISPIWNVIFIAAFSQGFFIGLVLLIQFFRSRQQSALFLGLFVLSFSYILLNNTIHWNELFDRYPHFLFIGTSVRYLIAPSFLLYCFTFINKKISLKHSLHFLPFAFLLVLDLPQFFLSGEEKLVFVQRYALTGEYTIASMIGYFSFKLVAIHLLIYAMLVFFAIRNFVKRTFDLDAKKLKQLNWLRILNSLFLIYGLLMLLYFILVGMNVGGIEKDYFVSFAMCLAVYGISCIGLLNPELLNGEQIIENINAIKYGKTRLKKEQLEKIVDGLEELMHGEKIFLDADINLNGIAEKMKSPKHHISQALSLQRGRTFHEYINYYRVKHAQDLLDNISGDKTIKTIMYSSGFNNRASFNNNFKKITGMTASQYIKSSKLQS